MKLRMHAALMAGVAVLLAAHSPLHARPADEDLPMVSILEPEFGKAISGTTQIRIAYERGKNPIRSAVFLVDGKLNFEDRAKFADRGEEAYDFKTKGYYEDGMHRLTVRLVDSEGYSSSANAVIFIANSPVLSLYPPTVKIMSLMDGQSVSGQVPITVRTSSEGGVVWVFLYVSQPVTPTTLKQLSIMFKDVWPENRLRTSVYQTEFLWDTSTLANGVYVLQVKSEDFFKKTGYSDRLRVFVNNLAGQTAINPKSNNERTVDPVKRPDHTVVVTPPRAAPPRESGPLATLHPWDERDVIGADAAVMLALGNPARPGVSLPDGNVRVIVLPAKTTVAGVTGNPGAATGADHTPYVRLLAVAPGTSAPTLDLRRGAPRVSPERVIVLGEPLVADLMLMATPTMRRADARPGLDVPGIGLRARLSLPRMSVAGAVGGIAAAEGASPSRTGLVSLTPTASSPAGGTRSGNPVMSPLTTSGSLDPAHATYAITQPMVFIAVESGAPDSGARNQSRLPVTSLAGKAGPATTGSADLLSRPRLVAIPVIIVSPETGGRRKSNDTPKLVGPRATPSGIDANLATAGSSGVRAFGPTLPTLASAPNAALDLRMGTPRMSANRPEAVGLQTAIGGTAPRNAVAEKAWTPTVAAPAGSARGTTPGSRTMASGPAEAASAVRATMMNFDVAARISLAAVGQPGLARTTLRVTTAAPFAVTHTSLKEGPAIRRADPFIQHRVRRGDSLDAIAREYGLPVTVVAKANGLPASRRLATGHTVLVPRHYATYLNGRELEGSVKSFPMMAGPVAPFRAIVEGVGGRVGWQGRTQIVTASTGSKNIRLQIGRREASVNGRTTVLDLASFLFSGRTMVPATFFKSALDATVVLDPQTGSLTITAPQK